MGVGSINTNRTQAQSPLLPPHRPQVLEFTLCSKPAMSMNVQCRGTIVHSAGVTFCVSFSFWAPSLLWKLRTGVDFLCTLYSLCVHLECILLQFSVHLEYCCALYVRHPGQRWEAFKQCPRLGLFTNPQSTHVLRVRLYYCLKKTLFPELLFM